MAYIAVGIAGVLGALLRYELGRWIPGSSDAFFPLATWIVNLSGCLVLSFLTVWFAQAKKIPPAVKTGLTTGWIGSYTTFSTFAVENVELLRNGHAAIALAYILCSLFGGLLMAGLGDWLGHRIFPASKEGSADVRS
nr:fluoride efflux transporter CrcB [Cohnella sp. YIM B05605]